MNGLIAKRTWLDWITRAIVKGLTFFNLDGGRVKSKTATIVLTLVCTVGVVAGRSLKLYAIPFIPFDPGAIFMYLPLLMCPWVVTIPIIGAAFATTGTHSVVSIIGLTTAVQLVYFGGRFLESHGWGKYRLLAVAFGSFTGLTVAALCLDLMGLVPFVVGFPVIIIRSLISISVCAFGIPPVWRVLRKKGLM